MERLVQSVLQRVLGFERYLVWFARFKIRTLRWDRNERDVLHFIDRLPDEGAVLDVGANIGIMTVLFARSGRDRPVHAFEPIPENCSALRRNLEHYGLQNVTVHEVAVGDHDGELEMVMPVERGVRMQGLSHVVGAAGQGDAAGEQGSGVDVARYRVPVRRLDDMIDLTGTPVAGIKIDVENFEQYVLEGGRELIERWHPPIYTELGANENRERCIELLDGLGYSVKVFEDGEPVPYDPARHEQHNFLLWPPVPWAQRDRG